LEKDQLNLTFSTATITKITPRIIVDLKSVLSKPLRTLNEFSPCPKRAVPVPLT